MTNPTSSTLFKAAFLAIYTRPASYTSGDTPFAADSLTIRHPPPSDTKRVNADGIYPSPRPTDHEWPSSSSSSRSSSPATLLPADSHSFLSTYRFPLSPVPSHGAASTSSFGARSLPPTPPYSPCPSSFLPPPHLSHSAHSPLADDTLGDNDEELDDDDDHEMDDELRELRKLVQMGPADFSGDMDEWEGEGEEEDSEFEWESRGIEVSL
ncbi:hypothetical protein JCM6882_004275 [Rhodosporidiobolus microsporus]